MTIFTNPILPEDSANVNESAERTDNVEDLKVLGQKRDEYQGDFVLNGQETSKTHSHVSKIWFDQCLTYEQGFAALAEQQSQIHDLKAPLSAWEPVVNDDDKFVIRYKPTNREYTPTEHCIDLLLSAVPVDKGSTWEAKQLIGERGVAAVKQGGAFKRDRRDAELACALFDLHVFQPDRVDQDKTRLFRTWDDDNSLRAVLSDDYTIVNNEWFLQTVSKIIPGGMLSHWKGDADTIYGNVLIPDSIRFDEDSDYGGMLGIGNSEIGCRRITSFASVFRAICRNGCIWDAELGKGINQIHRKKGGEVDLPALAAKIKTNLEAQIPLIDEGIRRVLSIKTRMFDKVPALNVIAATIAELRLPKKAALGIVQAYRTEQPIVGDSAFTVMQALTRWGQTQNALQWVSMDVAAGKIVQMNENRWQSIIKKAQSYADKDLVKIGVLTKD